MKKLLGIFGACLIAAGTFSSFGFAAETKSPALTEGCKSAYLMDFDSGECVYKEN